MAYVKIIDGQPVKYTAGQLRRDNPNVSFPDQLSDAVLAEYGMHPLAFAPQPNNDIVELGPIELIDGVWTQTYIGRDRTPEERRAAMIVTSRQARLALQQQGLLAQLSTAIEAMQEPDKSLVSIEWEYATQIERTSSWVSTMGTAIGLDDADLDALFVAAAAL